MPVLDFTPEPPFQRSDVVQHVRGGPMALVLGVERQRVRIAFVGAETGRLRQCAFRASELRLVARE